MLRMTATGCRMANFGRVGGSARRDGPEESR